MLNDEVALYTELSGKDGSNTSIGVIGAYLDGYEKGKSERKKGEWINKPDIYLDEQTWECSECGEPWIFIDGTPSENNANFCPNCGADMMGE